MSIPKLTLTKDMFGWKGYIDNKCTFSIIWPLSSRREGGRWAPPQLTPISTP